MINLFRLLEDNRDRAVMVLLHKIPKEVPSYKRLPRAELKESLIYMLNNYFNYLITGDNSGLRSYFRYLAKRRSAQSFRAGVVVRAFLCAPPVLRLVLQDACRHLDENGQASFNKFMHTIDISMSECTALLTDAFLDHVQSRIDEHNAYLANKSQQLKVDLSKLILLKA